MAIPTPEPGLVISYAYLWDREAQDGQEEGRKDRPCVVALAVQRRQDGETWVTVLPVTHSPPRDAASAVEIPQAIKHQLGFDDARSWVVVSEGDQFVWPGYDLRKARGSDRYDRQSSLVFQTNGDGEDSHVGKSFENRVFIGGVGLIDGDDDGPARADGFHGSPRSG